MVIWESLLCLCLLFYLLYSVSGRVVNKQCVFCIYLLNEQIGGFWHVIERTFWKMKGFLGKIIFLRCKDKRRLSSSRPPPYALPTLPSSYLSGISPGFRSLGGVKVCGLILLKGKPQCCVTVFQGPFHNKHNIKHSQSKFILN